jgi:hypothetical protein
VEIVSSSIDTNLLIVRIMMYYKGKRSAANLSDLGEYFMSSIRSSIADAGCISVGNYNKCFSTNNERDQITSSPVDKRITNRCTYTDRLQR